MTRLPLVAGAPLAFQLPARRPRALTVGVGVYRTDPTGVTATADAATAHTPGAWVEIVAALAGDVDLVVGANLSALSTGGVNTSTLVDLAVGAGGSEVVVAAGLNLGNRVAGAGNVILPLGIPAGSRVAFRCQSAVLSKTVTMRWACFRSGVPAQARLAAFGVNTATSRGVDPVGTTVNIDGAWSTLVDPVPEPLVALVVTISGAGGTTYANATQVIDIGIGPAGSETVIIEDLSTRLDTSENLTQGLCGPFTVAVPAGARLACRMNRANATNAVSVVAHGVKLAT